MSGLRVPIVMTIAILLFLPLNVAICRPSGSVSVLASVTQPAAASTRNLPPLSHVSEFDNRAPNVYTGF